MSGPQEEWYVVALGDIMIGVIVIAAVLLILHVWPLAIVACLSFIAWVIGWVIRTTATDGREMIDFITGKRK